MFKQRVITGLVLLAIIFVVLFLLPRIVLFVLLMLVFGIAAWEWSNLASINHPLLKVGYAGIVVLVVLGLAYWARLDTSGLRDIVGVACIWWALALYWVVYYPGSVVYWGHTSIKILMGFFVLVPSAIALMYLGSLPYGHWIFLYVVGIVVMADVGAYFVGKALGKSKLAPHVSPGKSWEGFWGGFVCCLIYAAIVGAIYPVAGLASVSLIVVTGLASLASVLGDLLESMLKRERGIKDSSQLLPGHGGFMDRIDSITAAAPVFTFLALLLRVG